MVLTRCRTAAVLALIGLSLQGRVLGQQLPQPGAAMPSPELVLQPMQSGTTAAMKFGGNGRWLVVSSWSSSMGTVSLSARVIDMSTGRTVRSLTDSDFAMHPTRDLLVIAEGSGGVGMHPATGSQEWKLEIPRRRPTSAACSSAATGKSCTAVTL